MKVTTAMPFVVRSPFAPLTKVPPRSPRPVYRADGQVIAAIAIGALADRFESEHAKLRQTVLNVAGRFSGEQREQGGTEEWWRGLPPLHGAAQTAHRRK